MSSAACVPVSKPLFIGLAYTTLRIGYYTEREGIQVMTAMFELAAFDTSGELSSAQLHRHDDKARGDTQWAE